MRQRLLLDPQHRALQQIFVVGRLDLFSQMLDGARQKAARAAGGVQHLLAKLRVDHIDHELRDGSRRVVFARVARALQVFQDLLVEVTEDVPVLGAVEVETLVESVDDLPQQRPVLHVLIGVLEDIVDDLVTLPQIERQTLGGGDVRQWSLTKLRERANQHHKPLSRG